MGPYLASSGFQLIFENVFLPQISAKMNFVMSKELLKKIIEIQTQSWSTQAHSTRAFKAQLQQQ